MTKIEEEIFVCVDCETTGLDTNKDRIIEVAAIKFTLKENLTLFETLIDPEIKISKESIEIHNITDEMVKGKPKINEILPELLSLIDDHIIMGHGIKFDIEMIANAAKRANIPCHIRENKIIDTLRMARHYGGSPTNSLEQLRAHFNIEEEGAHRAMADVIVNCDVFKFLSKQYRNVDQIFKTLSKPIKLKEMPLGKHKGRPFKDVPLQYLHWAANKDFDEDLLYTIRTEINSRKKGNLFSQSANPFADL